VKVRRVHEFGSRGKKIIQNVSGEAGWKAATWEAKNEMEG
jgi:hypothetical protein